MGSKVLVGRKLSRGDVLFAVGCALAYAITALLAPYHAHLIEPDSASYLAFSPFRTSLYPAFLYLCRMLGLSLVQITWVQLAIFAPALSYFLAALLRSGFPKWLLVLMVLVLAGNVLFSSFHFSILTESISFSLTMAAVGCWIDYLRTRRIGELMAAGLALGLMIGVRPAAVGLLPLHLLAAWLRRPNRFGLWVALLLALLPIGIGIGGERALSYAVHGSGVTSLAPKLLFGKAAMLVRPGMKFTGPHAQALQSLAAQLDAIYAPLQRDVAQAPTLAIRAELSAIYEETAQYRVMTQELAEAARRERTSADSLRVALGRQIMWQNPIGYLRLTLLNDFGQWSVMANNFPSTARKLATYAAAHPGMSLAGAIPANLFHPQPSRAALIIYPGFLMAGVLTLVLAFCVLAFIVRPALADSPAGFYLLIATFLSAMCHSYTLFVGLVNVWTPRYLMLVFPQLEVTAVCLVMALLVNFKGASTRRPAADAITPI